MAVYDPIKTYRQLGLDVGDEKSGQYVGDCPFCGKVGHFYMNYKNGLWDCKVCGRQGNVRHFIGHWLDMYEGETTLAQLTELSKLRNLKISTLQTARFVYNPEHKRWYFPVLDMDGRLHTMRRWSSSTGTLALAGIPVMIYRGYTIKGQPPDRTVWLCEGEWDGLAMLELLKVCGRNDYVVATPGAQVFKREWASLFQNMNVVVCGDNDDAGDDMAEKVTTMTKPYRAHVRYLNWPVSFPVGYDIRAFIGDHRRLKEKPLQIVAELDKLVESKSRRTMTAATKQDDKEKLSSSTLDDMVTGGNENLATFNEVINIFDRWLTLDDDMVGAITLSLAVAISNRVEGEPLWLYLVGPSGSGKTEILLALQDSARTLFRSSLTGSALVSGWAAAQDPSLLPMMNGKTAIFKDGTEILTLPLDARQQIYSTLRGAYDGHVFKQFGHLSREYLNLHFNMLIGVTPEIHRDNTAMLGERFMKYQMRDSGNTEDKIRSAISNAGQEKDKVTELNDVCKRFLRKAVDSKHLPAIPNSIIDKIIPLAQYVSMLQSQVSREVYGGDRALTHRPSHAFGTRAGRQLSKLARVVAVVLEQPEVDNSVYRLIFKVGLDSCVGFHHEVVETCVVNDPERKGMLRQDIATQCDMGLSTLQRRLEDLEALHILERDVAPMVPGKRGPPPYLWRITQEIHELWERMKPEGFFGARRVVPAVARSRPGKRTRI